MIPIECKLGMFSSEDIKLMTRKIDNFYYLHPATDVPKKLHYNIEKENTHNILENIWWYMLETEVEEKD